jgi:hypothetical protein
VYKVGAGGKVDLKFKEAGIGKKYYKDHLLSPYFAFRQHCTIYQNKGPKKKA